MAVDGGEQKQSGARRDEPDLPPQNLGVMFGAAAVALAFLLAIAGLVGYFALRP